MKLHWIILCLLLLGACKKENENNNTVLTYQFDFNSRLSGWVADFADYPFGQESFYELGSAHEILPSPLDQNKKGFMIQGNNHSDDLFMFAKKQVSGMKASSSYSFNFTLETASNASEGSIGVGGSPAHSVYVKVGATPEEPLKMVNTTDNSYIMNIDKGNQAMEGADMINIGDMSNGISEEQYVLISRNNNQNSFTAKSDASGQIWLIVGFDSGFESLTKTYLTKFTAIATPLE